MNGVQFDDMHTIKDWDLLMTSKNIADPTVVTKYVQIEGRNGLLDLTGANDEVVYSNRVLTFNFDMFQDPDDWWNLKSKISSYLHGKRRKITLDVDSDFYYEGRCQISSFTNDTTVAHISITCDCEPYKMKKHETIIQKNVKPGDSFFLQNLSKKVMPIVESTGNIVFKFENTQFSISEHLESPDFMLKEGNNKIDIISGTGTLKFTYREGII